MTGDSHTIVYRTKDGKRELELRLPLGIIAPPLIDCHRYAEGTITFHHPVYFGKTIPNEFGILSETR